MKGSEQECLMDLTQGGSTAAEDSVSLVNAYSETIS